MAAGRLEHEEEMVVVVEITVEELIPWEEKDVDGTVEGEETPICRELWRNEWPELAALGTIVVTWHTQLSNTW